MFLHITKPILLLLALTVVLTWRAWNRRKRVFLMDLVCYKPPDSQGRSRAELMAQLSSSHFNFTAESIAFMEEGIKKSGLADVTYVPEGIFKDPPNLTLPEALREARAVIFGTVEELLAKTGVRGADIGILIVNCTIFCPVPSLAAMIVNRFELEEGVRTYNLEGMGCTASLSAVGLAKHLLQVHDNTYALILSTENITQSCYQGDDRSMIVANCVFRVGGAAILLSNRNSDRRSAKYELIHIVHTTTASSDVSYNCIHQTEDSDGNLGVSITKDLIVVYRQAFTANVAALSRLILPFPDKLLYAVNCLLIRYLHFTNVKPYVPNFTNLVDHIFAHVAGSPVLDSLQKNLNLSDAYMEASRMTLYRFGNTSSSSTWYEIAYAEAKGRMKRDDRVWQIAFGSGFKCSSIIWRATRTISRDEVKNIWSDEIDKFPIHWAKTDSIPYHFD